MISDSLILGDRLSTEWELDTAAHALNFRGTKSRIGRVRAIIDSLLHAHPNVCIAS